jgi:hypothetical protein
MVESLKPAAFTLSPLLPNTLRILVLVEACNKSSKLSCRVLLPEPVMSITYGGMDVLNAGTGDDTIIINASNIAALEKTGSGNRARVDGGGLTTLISAISTHN